MDEPPRNESTHERLNRELARMRVRSVGMWGGIAVIVAVIGIYVTVALNTESNVRFVTGVAGETMPLMTEDGGLLLMRVEVEGVIRDIRLPSQLIHPEKGASVCLRAGERRITGHTSYTIVPDRHCEGPSATDQVE